MLRLGAIFSCLASAGWLAWELSRRTGSDGAASECNSGADYFNDLTFAVANVAAGLAFIALVPALARLPRWSGIAAASGAVAFGVGNALEHCVAEPLFVLYVAGAMLFVGASLIFAASLVLTNQLRRWPGILVGAGTIGLMIGIEQGGLLLTFVAWFVLAAWLSQADLPSEASPDDGRQLVA